MAGPTAANTATAVISLGPNEAVPPTALVVPEGHPFAGCRMSPEGALYVRFVPEQNTQRKNLA